MSFFSVVIPTYNAEATLEKCLDSVLNQTYKDVEVIIMDACSSDLTLTIIKERAANFNNIRWVSEKDCGIYDAMNKGIAQASGEWLYFLGSDDFLWDINVFADIAEEAGNHKADIIYGDAIVTSDGGRHGGKFDVKTLLLSHNLCHQTIFYKKWIFEIVGLYNIKYPIIADWDFNIRCFEKEQIVTHYVMRKIVLFNDVSGISSVSKKDQFYSMIPAPYIKEILELKKKYDIVINSNPYIISVYIYKIIKKTGIVKLISLIQRKANN